MRALAQSPRSPAVVALRRSPANDTPRPAPFRSGSPITLETLYEQLQALTAAVQRLAPPKLVTVADAAETLGVSEVTVRRRIKDGRLPSKRVGRAIRVDLRGV